MDYPREFERIMTQQCEIALATSVNNAPNVRIVNFYYDVKNRGKLYFSTFRENPKTMEFSENNRVAFTTIPSGGNEHVRVRNATVRKSDRSIYDLQNAFIGKIPEYAVTIQQAGSKLDLYEVHFKEASVTLDYTRSGNVTL